jgi:hypothetical protein
LYTRNLLSAANDKVARRIPATKYMREQACTITVFGERNRVLITLTV